MGENMLIPTLKKELNAVSVGIVRGVGKICTRIA
jgi:hypothetical protein